METRANHILIGGFVLVVIAVGFGFLMWLARIDIDKAFAFYHIRFEESVSGLGLGGDVRFNGILIGSVKTIEIDPDDPSLSRVLIEVSADAPIRTDTIAVLAFQGITGVSFVQLTGGEPDSPLLQPEKPGEIPVIPSKPSALQELFEGAPEIIDRVLILINRAAELVDDENRARFKSILANVDDITGELKDRQPQIESILVNADQMIKDLGEAARQANRLVTKVEGVLDSTDATLAVARGTLSMADQLLDQDVRALVADIRQTAQTATSLGQRLDRLMERNEEPIDVFASQGLIELTKFIEEARILVAGIERLLENIETDPAQFLFGRQKGGVEAK